jgi:hypothetical protein
MKPPLQLRPKLPRLAPAWALTEHANHNHFVIPSFCRSGFWDRKTNLRVSHPCNPATSASLSQPTVPTRPETRWYFRHSAFEKHGRRNFARDTGLLGVLARLRNHWQGSSRIESPPGLRTAVPVRKALCAALRLGVFLVRAIREIVFNSFPHSFPVKNSLPDLPAKP